MKASPSRTYFSAGQNPPGFSCRTFNHTSPLSLPLYFTAAEEYFCRKQAEYFAATNMSQPSARTRLRAPRQDCIPGLLICIWPQIMQAAWQDLKALERWSFMHPAPLYQHPALYQSTHRDKICGIRAAVGFEVQGKNSLLCLIYFGLPCSEPISPQALLLLVASGWSSCIRRFSPHCLKQEQSHTGLLLWKAAWVMFRRRETGKLAHIVSWHTKVRDREFWPLRRKVRVDSQCQQSHRDQDSELSLIKLRPLKLCIRSKEKLRGTEDPEAEMVTSLPEVTSLPYSHKFIFMRWWILQLFQRKRSYREHMGFWSPLHEFSPWAMSRQEQAMQKDVGDGWWVAIPERTPHLEWDHRLVPGICSQVVIASALASSLSVGPTNPALTSQSNSTHIRGAHRNLSKVQLWSRSIWPCNETGKSLVQGHTEFQIQREARTFKGTWVRAFDTTQSLGKGRKIWFKA